MRPHFLSALQSHSACPPHGTNVQLFVIICEPRELSIKLPNAGYHRSNGSANGLCPLGALELTVDRAAVNDERDIGAQTFSKTPILEPCKADQPMRQVILESGTI